MKEVKCDNCGEIFQITSSRFAQRKYRIKTKNSKTFCGKCKPFQNGGRPPIDCICKQCKTIFKKGYAQARNYPNHFCTQSCAATYNNTHKTKGNRRSKLEAYLEEHLIKIFPSINFLFNKKDVINSELDIYLPDLKLAFELNGVFHYEPIFGKEQLSKIQNNDHRKFQACLERNIALCIIDTSKQVYVKESTCKPFLDIVTSIINQRLDLVRLELTNSDAYKASALPSSFRSE